jgi:hypothetical protein
MEWDRFLHVLWFFNFADYLEDIRQTIWPIMGTKDNVWYTKPGLCQIQYIIWAFGSRQGKCRIQRQSYIHVVYSQEMFWHHNLQTLITESTHIAESVIKDAKTTTGNMMATHSTVTNLTCIVEGVGKNIFIANVFS